jgi:hypothetical protein
MLQLREYKTLSGASMQRYQMGKWKLRDRKDDNALRENLGELMALI